MTLRRLIPVVVLSTVPAAQDDRIEWLAKSAQPIRTIDPADSDFADLQFLKRVIGNARVVQLGAGWSVSCMPRWASTFSHGKAASSIARR